ncbi:MAG: hypothetical protein CBB68_10285 [Rhodospirillaceae bacterium TMED8]|nr:enoyl-CoA hydratase [Magnetovibrio sp.]OUT50240.1 MAG: hypothetical protein CBB68_10285 [Rhodospirillaceae bacterium TMED8]|tara:strand:+ start:2444 stop:3238 length:795 start_codon:yes stop_codon:yes gene_type:complete
MPDLSTLILTDLKTGIARITINRPEKRNAMTLSMWQYLGDLFIAFDSNPKVRVIILAGAGDKCFCAGNDISEFSKLRSTPSQIEKYDKTTEITYAAIRATSKPVIARIEGSCVGGGLELTQLCDIQVASNSSNFTVPPAKLGLGYKLNDTVLLVKNVGLKFTKEMLLTGRAYSANDALRWGLVNQVVPSEELDSVVACYATEIAANAPLSVKAGKLIAIEAAKDINHRDVAFCQTLVDACNASYDINEGRLAFTEKRHPNFQGK